jgi:hypothetical protein
LTPKRDQLGRAPAVEMPTAGASIKIGLTRREAGISALNNASRVATRAILFLNMLCGSNDNGLPSTEMELGTPQLAIYVGEISLRGLPLLDLYTHQSS